MMEDRKSNLLLSLLMTFRKGTKHETPEMQDPSVLESKRKIEERIEMAIGDLGDSAVDNAA